MIRATNAPNLGVMTRAVISAGLVNKGQLDEMKRWSPAIDAEAEAEPPMPLEQAAEIINEAIQSEGYVLLRETDLEVVRQYAATARTARLHIQVGDEPADSTDVEVTFGKTSLGEYIIAWRSESIKDAMVNGMTFLDDGPARVFFQDVRELFFGQQKAFMVCVPSTVEAHVD